MLSRFRLFSVAGIATLLTLSYAHSDEVLKKDANPAHAPQASKEEGEQPVDIKKLSEALGNFIGKNLDTPGVKFDLESIIKGIRDGAAGKPSPMNEKDYEAALGVIQEKAWSSQSETNLKAANDFLEANAHAPNIVVVEPGKLQYEILQKGDGATVNEHSKPMIKYTGKFINGEVFGSSEQNGGPITLPLDQTIPGFSKGLMGMKENEKRRLFIHPDFAYGTAGQLPPNSLLIFDIELIKADNAAGDKTSADAEDFDSEGEEGLTAEDDSGDEDFSDDGYNDATKR